MRDRSALFVNMAQRFLDKAVVAASDEAVKADIASLAVSVKAIQEKHVTLRSGMKLGVKKEV